MHEATSRAGQEGRLEIKGFTTDVIPIEMTGEGTVAEE